VGVPESCLYWEQSADLVNKDARVDGRRGASPSMAMVTHDFMSKMCLVTQHAHLHRRKLQFGNLVIVLLFLNNFKLIAKLPTMCTENCCMSCIQPPLMLTLSITTER
jgi:hypothetical protein